MGRKYTDRKRADDGEHVDPVPKEQLRGSTHAENAAKRDTIMAKLISPLGRSLSYLLLLHKGKPIALLMQGSRNIFSLRWFAIYGEGGGCLFHPAGLNGQSTSWTFRLLLLVQSR